ncbi:hypothetical protein KCU83_g541, partial [Aureobasidium melanogenum]
MILPPPPLPPPAPPSSALKAKLSLFLILFFPKSTLSHQMFRFLSTKRTTRIKAFLKSEKCLKICWMIQVLPMAFVSFPPFWGFVWLYIALHTTTILEMVDYVIGFAMWIMGCSFLVQATTFPRPWLKDWVMLANMMFESVVCSAAILRFSPAIAEKDGAAWIVGLMVCTTMSVSVLTVRSYLVWRNGVTRADEEEEVGMIVL